jgi:hypothetical protein
MIKFTGENSFFLPNYSRNQINAENKIPELVSNDFSIEVNTKLDWKKCIKKMDYKNHFELGITAFNGMPFGVVLRKAWPEKGQPNTPAVSATVWVQGKDKLEPVYCDVIVSEKFKGISNIKMNYVKDKSLELIVNGNGNKVDLHAPIADYSEAWLWVGCCSGFPFTPTEHQGFFEGEISSLKISTNDYDFLDCDFSITNGRKIFDDSEFGHHLLNRYLNVDNTLVVF